MGKELGSSIAAIDQKLLMCISGCVCVEKLFSTQMSSSRTKSDANLRKSNPNLTPSRLQSKLDLNKDVIYKMSKTPLVVLKKLFF